MALCPACFPDVAILPGVEQQAVNIARTTARECRSPTSPLLVSRFLSTARRVPSRLSLTDSAGRRSR